VKEKAIHYHDSEFILEAGISRYERPEQWRVQFDNRGGHNDPEICVPCNKRCSKLLFVRYETGEYERYKHLYFCDRCHWWRLIDEFCDDEGNTRHIDQFWSLLKKFSISANDIPINILKSYLSRKYSDVTLISAQKAEELVASIFRECLGPCEVSYFQGSTYAPDEGIDLVVIQADAGLTAVQVKRRVNKKVEPIESVRAFVAALILKGFRKGVYVTLASTFSKQTTEIAVNPGLKNLGLELQLVNCDRFYQLLMQCAPNRDRPPWISLVGDYDSCSNRNLLAKLVEEFRIDMARP
jgi:hypothetical protein